MKKLLSLLAGVMTLTVMNACTLSASAAPLMESDRPEYDFYWEQLHYSVHEDGTVTPIYDDVYFDFESDYGGSYYEYGRFYSYAFLTTTPDTDMDALEAVLGEEQKDICFYLMEENQHAFTYAADVDYESLYDIPGVEKVELAKSLCIGMFGTYFCRPDAWSQEMIGDKTPEEVGMLMSYVDTEPGVELTMDMFADSSFNVRHIAFNEPNNKWCVYFDFDGLRSYRDFDVETMEIEGVVDAQIPLLIAASAPEENYELDLVAKAQEGSTEPSAEPPTDAPTDLPTEAETAAPTEAPTNAPTEAPTNAPTEAPTNAPTEASANASTVSNPQTGDANTYKLVMGLAVLTAAGAGILIKTKKEKE